MKIKLKNLTSIILLIISIPALSQTIHELTDADCGKLAQDKTAVYIYNSEDQERLMTPYQEIANDPEFQAWTFYKKAVTHYAPGLLTTLPGYTYPSGEFMRFCDQDVSTLPIVVLPANTSQNKLNRFFAKFTVKIK